MDLTLPGIVMLVRDVHPLKVLSPIDAVLEDSFTFLSKGQASKAEFPIFVTLSGIVMLVRESHLANAYPSIWVTLFGIEMFVSDEHPEKAPFPM